MSRDLGPYPHSQEAFVINQMTAFQAQLQLRIVTSKNSHVHSLIA